jgi:hypothetical protein
MTEVVTYFCKKCKKEYGPMGMHGFEPAKGNGELPVVCRKCKTMTVKQFTGKKMETPNCPVCKSKYEILDGTCPSCGSEEFYFKDVNAGELERKAVNLKKIYK